MHAPQGVATSGRTPQPLFPEPREAVLFQRVQTAQAGPEHHQAGFQENGDRDTGLSSGIPDRRDDPFRKTVQAYSHTGSGGGEWAHSLRLSSRCHSTSRSFLQQLLDFLIALNALADAFFPLLGHEHLARLAPLALYQVQRRVQLAAGTATVWFPAPAQTRRQRAAEKALARDHLRQTRTAFRSPAGRLDGIREGSSSDILLLYQKESTLSSKKRMRICSVSGDGPKPSQFQTVKSGSKARMRNRWIMESYR